MPARTRQRDALGDGSSDPPPAGGESNVRETPSLSTTPSPSRFQLLMQAVGMSSPVVRDEVAPGEATPVPILEENDADKDAVPTAHASEIDAKKVAIFARKCARSAKSNSIESSFSKWVTYDGTSQEAESEVIISSTPSVLEVVPPEKIQHVSGRTRNHTSLGGVLARAKARKVAADLVPSDQHLVAGGLASARIVRLPAGRAAAVMTDIANATPKRAATSAIRGRKWATKS